MQGTLSAPSTLLQGQHRDEEGGTDSSAALGILGSSWGPLGKGGRIFHLLREGEGALGGNWWLLVEKAPFLTSSDATHRPVSEVVKIPSIPILCALLRGFPELVSRGLSAH